MSARSFVFAFLLALATGLQPTFATAAEKVFRAGAAKVDVTPTKFPVVVNCGFLENSASKANSKLHARCLVLDDGKTRLAFVVVDSCMMPRELIDEAKSLAVRETGIPADRLMISATHTHTAPAAMPCLGSRVDELYNRGLPELIVRSIVEAVKNLRPAHIGWTSVAAWEFTNCRRWVTRPDQMQLDPFGLRTVRAMMHPGYENPNYVAPSGPIDPEMSLLSVRTPDGKPLAMLANFSMHYFGASPVSADYFGVFSERIGQPIGATEGEVPFVGIMSQGTSGDSHWMDYSKPRKQITMEEYADGLVKLTAEAYLKIRHREWVPLGMAETKLSLRRRLPDAERLAWAKKLAAEMGDRLPKNRTEVYVKEQLELVANPVRELKLQAIRVGDLGITAIPNEVFAITGLKLKAQSPFPATFNIELANGAEGYIPPPEQHKLGGYTTWPARSAGLEVNAEPKITEAMLGLLEAVSEKKRRPLATSHGPYAKAVLDAKPVAYWRLDDAIIPTAIDATGNHSATFEDGVALYLPGAQANASAISAIPERPSAFSGNAINRAPQFAGGRVKAILPKFGPNYSVEFWFWNGIPTNLRPVTGYLFSRGKLGDGNGDHLGLGGTARPEETGRLFLADGDTKTSPLVGKTVLKPRTWNHVAFVREGKHVVVYLNGAKEPEIVGEMSVTFPENSGELFLGGRPDGVASFEGKIDEWAVFERKLSADEIARRHHIVRP